MRNSMNIMARKKKLLTFFQGTIVYIMDVTRNVGQEQLNQMPCGEFTVMVIMQSESAQR